MPQFPSVSSQAFRIPCSTTGPNETKVSGGGITLILCGNHCRDKKPLTDNPHPSGEREVSSTVCCEKQGSEMGVLDGFLGFPTLSLP